MPPTSIKTHVDKHVTIYSKPNYIETYLNAYAPYLTNSYRRGLEHLTKYKPVGANLLDLGSGFGYFLSIARNYGYTVRGIEATPSLAAKAKDMYDIDIISGDVLDIQVEANHYDIITAWDMLEHCADTVSILNRIAQALRKDGILLIRIPDFSFMQQNLPPAFVQRYLRAIYPLDIHEHVFHFSQISMINLLSRAGFEIIELWQSRDNEYTPRDVPDYNSLLNEMRQHNIACEMNYLCRLAGS
jgi:2-polyprenyl-3-methyl-5-hydroxy-6-metoxy-1,4-benzoquinol methylase